MDEATRPERPDFQGGEPACWLDRVCDDCGRLRERSGPGPCDHCGALPDGDPGERSEVEGDVALSTEESPEAGSVHTNE